MTRRITARKGGDPDALEAYLAILAKMEPTEREMLERDLFMTGTSWIKDGKRVDPFEIGAIRIRALGKG